MYQVYRTRCHAHALAVLCLSLLPLLSRLNSPLLAMASHPVMQTLADTAGALGWPTTVTLRPDLPGRAWYITASGATASPNRWATISMLQGAEQGRLFDGWQEQGMMRGAFHAWRAIMSRARDADGRASESDLTDPGRPVGVGAYAPQHAPGTVAWSCGACVLAAFDADGGGDEWSTAETLYAAAVQHGLCRSTGAVVILAETDDAPGAHSLPRFRALAQILQHYYAQNSYGLVDLALAFMDADGPAGAHDWYNVGPSLEAFRDDECAYAEAAIACAFGNAQAPTVSYLETAIVVFPAWVGGPLPPIASSSFTQRDGYYVRIPQAAGEGRLYIQNLVLIHEEKDTGTWAHEMGHTLYSQYPWPRRHPGLSDRYDSDLPGQQFGYAGRWDLMGTGGHWGDPQGASPTHMSSYTKEAATWLRYTPALLGEEYVLGALENQRAGDVVLKLDDPLSNDPQWFYIIEARDATVAFGAPESGVVIYHVRYDHGAAHAVVVALTPQVGEVTRTRGEQGYERPTLHGASRADGATTYTHPAAGFCVRLLGESYSPYKATVRIEGLLTAP